jgi:hypothetical protein
MEANRPKGLRAVQTRGLSLGGSSGPGPRKRSRGFTAGSFTHQRRAHLVGYILLLRPGPCFSCTNIDSCRGETPTPARRGRKRSRAGTHKAAGVTFVSSYGPLGRDSLSSLHCLISTGYGMANLMYRDTHETSQLPNETYTLSPSTQTRKSILPCPSYLLPRLLPDEDSPSPGG